jgi:hypothetical protein
VSLVIRSRRPQGLEAQTLLDNLLHNYSVESGAFFDRLRAEAGQTSAAQFAFYRANYLARTMTTLPCLRLVLAAAQRQRPVDSEIVQLVQATIEEEEGGNGKPAHSELLAQSHNVHGSIAFGLPQLSLAESENSCLLVAETIQYRRIQLELYQSESFATVLGAFAAQESAAHEMLSVFYETLFAPMRGVYGPVNFGVVSGYFSEHLNGVEEEHGRRARECVLRALSSKQDLHDFRVGAREFLRAQSALWRSLLNEWNRYRGIQTSLAATG